MSRALNIWIVAVGEPLPLDGPDERLLRAGLLARCLVGRGHTVTWWTSAFDHRRKTFRAQPEAIEHAGILFQLLKGSGYKRNVSLKRMRDHRQVAREFSRRAPQYAQPDALFVAYPTAELADAAERYAEGIGRPVIVDVRDLWPDIFVDAVPSILRALAKTVQAGMTRQSANVLRRATAITGITDAFVDWGVIRAGRSRRSSDRAFPLASEAPELSHVEFQTAATSLLKRGVDLGSTRKRAVFTGTLGKQFELNTVFEAADKVRDLPLDFVIAGSGESEQSLRASAGRLSNVSMPGWLDRAELAALLANAAVGLAPYRSTWDFEASIPNKVIEYLASALPVVSSLRGEVASLVSSEECGISYAVGSADSLATALRRLLNDQPRLEKMKHNARSLFNRRFSGTDVYPAMAGYIEAMAG